MQRTGDDRVDGSAKIWERMSKTLLDRLAITAAVVVLAGCGGHTESGRAIFAHECAGCHTIAGHESGAPGGDLAHLRLTVADIASFARVMPTPSRLSESEVNAVARYVRSRR